MGLVRAACRRPGAWLAVCGLLTALAAAGLLRLEVRTDGAAIHPTGHPVVENTAAEGRRFRDLDQVVVLLTPEPGAPGLYSAAGLRRIRDLHEALEGLPGVHRGRVRSLASLPDPRPEVPLILTPDFLDQIPEDPGELALLLERLRASAVAQGLFLSPGGGAAAFYVPVARDADRGRVVAALERWAREHSGGGYRLRLTGPVAAEVTLGARVLADLARMVPLMVVVMALLLFWCLKSVAGVLVPLAAGLATLAWTLGAMGHLGVPVTLVTTILPVLLLTVAVIDEIHLLERFASHLHQKRSAREAEEPARVEGDEGQGEAAAREKDRRRHALQRAVAEVGRPIAITSLTTAVAFLSFLSAAMAPVRHLGLFTAAGVLVAMALTFTLVPALLMVVPAGWLRAPRAWAAQPRSGLSRLERLALRHRRHGPLLACLLLVAGLLGATRLTVDDSWVGNFDPASDLVTAVADYDAHFWGAYPFDLVLEAPARLYFHQAEGLRLLAEVERRASQAPHVGGIASHLDIYQKGADATEEAGEAGEPVWELPPERLATLARLLDRASRRLDLDRLLVADGCRARLRLFVPDADYTRARKLEDHLREALPPLLGGTGVAFHVSGELPLARAVVDAVVGNVLRSVAWTAVGVLLLLALLFGSPRAALVVAAPLASGLAIVLGGMGAAGLPLGIATSLFAALTIGVAVDFAIHLSHAYHRHRASLEPAAALEATFGGAGRAVRWSAAVLGLGLATLALSSLAPNRQLGLLLGAAMGVCYLTTLLTLPRLLAGRPHPELRGAGDSAPASRPAKSAKRRPA